MLGMCIIISRRFMSRFSFAEIFMLICIIRFYFSVIIIFTGEVKYGYI